jgi:hypothetical protein
VPARIFVATGDARDECVIEDYCSRAVEVPAKLIIVMAERVAMGIALRAMSPFTQQQRQYDSNEFPPKRSC